MKMLRSFNTVIFVNFIDLIVDWNVTDPLSQVIMGAMEGNHIGRQDAGGSGDPIEYDIPVPGHQKWLPNTRQWRHMMRLFPLNTLVYKL